MEYKYISGRTKENLVLSKYPTHHILKSFGMIKNTTRRSEGRWGIFLLDKKKEEIVGVSSVIEEEEDDIKYILLDYIFIDKNYRGKNYCYELVKHTILKYKNKKNKGNLIKVVIAGGEPILKCLLKVFNNLKYKVKKYKSDEKEEISKLKNITYEEAIKIEKKNKRYDKWQTLFFTP